MKYILIGLHEKESDNRLHFRDLAREIYNFLVIKTIEEAEEVVKGLTVEDREDYHILFNMNVLDRKKVDNSGLLKKFDPKRITLFYNHSIQFAPAFVPAREN